MEAKLGRELTEREREEIDEYVFDDVEDEEAAFKGGNIEHD